MTAKKKEEAPQSLWDKLSHIDVSDRIEEKNGLKYLSWAWAWGPKCYRGLPCLKLQEPSC